MSKDQARIVELQRQVKIARAALTRIANGHHYGTPERHADAALTEMWPLDQKQQLQGIVGHERRKA